VSYCPVYESPFLACVDHSDGTPFYTGDPALIKLSRNRKKTVGKTALCRRINTNLRPDVDFVLGQWYSYRSHYGSDPPRTRCCRGTDEVLTHQDESAVQFFTLDFKFRASLPENNYILGLFVRGIQALSPVEVKLFKGFSTYRKNS
jgi:hypothetical protein